MSIGLFPNFPTSQVKHLSLFQFPKGIIFNFLNGFFSISQAIQLFKLVFFQVFQGDISQFFSWTKVI